MRAARAPTATSRSTSRSRGTPRPSSFRIPRSGRPSSCASRRWRAPVDRATSRGTSAASPSSSTPQEGNFDLVGNNIPVFFIQDAVKFPDLIHAVKPEPHNEMPQAASAHDTFWDFISLMPESMHMIMWVMSDRAIPRSLRMMEGFGVHTFRLVDERGDVPLREVSLEARPRRALRPVGRGAEDLREGPGLSAARPVGGDRERRIPRVGARPADHRGEGRAHVRVRPAGPDQARPRGARAGQAGRPPRARPEPRQLLRGDGTGRLSPRAPRLRHRFHQ